MRPLSASAALDAVPAPEYSGSMPGTSDTLGQRPDKCTAARVGLRSRASALARTLAIGYILYFWSERAFWSFWRDTDQVRDSLITWLVYSLIGAVFTTLVRWYRASAWPAVFLAGAVYGWLAEGVIVGTTYGDPSSPFPLSISFTGLSWHAAISVCLGWWWLGRALAAGNLRTVALRSGLLGAGWGFWAIWWQTGAEGRFPTTIAAFCTHALVSSAILLAAYWLAGRLAGPTCRPPMVTRVALGGLVLAFFFLARVPATPIAVLVLPPLLALCWLGLRRSRTDDAPPDAIQQVMGRYGARQCAGLLALPIAACFTYACLAWTRLPSNVILYLVTMPLGFWLFGRSLYLLLRRDQPEAPAG